MVVCYGKVKFLYTLNVRRKSIAENNQTFHVRIYEVKILSYDIYLLHIGLLNFNFRKVFEVTFFRNSNFLLNKVIAYLRFATYNELRHQVTSYRSPEFLFEEVFGNNILM